MATARHHAIDPHHVQPRASRARADDVIPASASTTVLPADRGRVDTLVCNYGVTQPGRKINTTPRPHDRSFILV
jgi:hypothetical protein